MDTAVLERAWKEVRAPLLRIGKSGPARSHANSLRELCGAHALVSVKLNGRADIEEVASQLKALASDDEEEATLPALIAARKLRRGGSEAMFTQRGRVETVSSMAYYEGLDEARAARLADDAKYEALREEARGATPP